MFHLAFPRSRDGWEAKPPQAQQVPQAAAGWVWCLAQQQQQQVSDFPSGEPLLQCTVLISCGCHSHGCFLIPEDAKP